MHVPLQYSESGSHREVGPVGGAITPASVHDQSIIHVATILLRYRRMVLFAPAVAIIASLIASFVLPRTYTAMASFVPQSPTPSQLSSLASLPAQLGLGLGRLAQGATFGSPDFYKELLQTRQILGEIADTPFDIPIGTRRFHGTLADYWRIHASTPERTRDRVIQRLRDHVLDVKIDQRIQLVEVRATTKSPDLSRAIVEQALELVNRFNQDKRQSQSAEERRFVGARLEDAKRELRQAEDTIARFMERNRDFRNSPALAFQYERLQREVALRQTLYTTLSQGYEQSRIDEVRDTPVITIVERPELPPRPESRQLVLKVALALVVGTLLGTLAAISTEFFAREAPRKSADLAEFQRLVVEIRQELRRPWRLVYRRGT